MQIKIAKTDEEIRACHEVMILLGKRRAKLSEDQFLEQVKRQQKNDNFILAYLETDGTKVAVAGYRYAEFLAYGKTLHLDDLVTRQNERSKGAGTFFMEWLEQQARENDCERFILGSGTERGKAHKFYFTKDFVIDDYYFCKKLKGE